MNATETLKEERAMQDKSPTDKALMLITELAMHNVTVRRLLMGFALGRCSFEDALIGMVVTLHEQNKSIVDELVKRPVVYTAVTIPEGMESPK